MRVLSFSEPDQDPFNDLAKDISESSTLSIVTYNTDCQMLQMLKKRAKGTRLLLLTNLPNRWNEYWSEKARARAKQSIDNTLEALKPADFAAPEVEIRFCFDNHAKIVLCDDTVAYVGSANFSSGSRGSFEAGYVTRRPEDIIQIRQFIDILRCNSISYDAIASSHELMKLSIFANSVPSLVEMFEEETMEWVANNYTDDVEPRFSRAKFGMPIYVEDAIRSAAEAASKIELKWKAEVLTLDEKAFVDNEVPSLLTELLELAQTIERKDALHCKRETDILADLIARSPDDPDSIQASEEFQNRVSAEEENARTRAKDESAQFIKAMNDARSAIKLAFKHTPKVDNTNSSQIE